MAQVRRWTPFAELESLRREIDRVFREFFGEERPARGWEPPVDIYETPTEVILQAELPGINPKDITIDWAGDRLTLRGKRERQTEENVTYHLLERSYGEFERTFNLTIPVDIEKAEANYRDGVLTIRLPKVEPQKARRIQVKVE